MKDLIDIGCGGRIRTCDLWVMSPTSCLAAPPRDAFKLTEAFQDVKSFYFLLSQPKQSHRVLPVEDHNALVFYLIKKVFFSPKLCAVMTKGRNLLGP
jgi:hypothetical protein